MTTQTKQELIEFLLDLQKDLSNKLLDTRELSNESIQAIYTKRAYLEELIGIVKRR